MYSEKITQEHIERTEQKLKLRLRRYDIGQSLDRTASILKVWNKNAPTRNFTSEEIQFIRNEQIVCKLDFHYWSERYAQIIKDGVDGGGIGNLNLWDSQRAIMQLIARLEEECWDTFKRGEAVDGILICLNKARQLGATMISRAIIIHRLSLYDHTRGFSASVDEDKVMELYERDTRIIYNLPFFLVPAIGYDKIGQPELGYDKKSEHIVFQRIDSSILYQHGKQQSGLGQGRQFEVSHITEAASFPYPKMLEHDYFPTIPQSIWAFCLAESTPQGRGGWWHQWSEKVRMGRMSRWRYLFVPVYIERKKYRRTPPVDWIPEPLTLQYARRIEETSQDIIGYKFIPEKDHLYWWESTRREYAEMDSLNLFLTNYACTPQESFQHLTTGALKAQLIEKLRMSTSEPVSYEFRRV